MDSCSPSTEGLGWVRQRTSPVDGPEICRCSRSSQRDPSVGSQPPSKLSGLGGVRLRAVYLLTQRLVCLSTGAELNRGGAKAWLTLLLLRGVELPPTKEPCPGKNELTRRSQSPGEESICFLGGFCASRKDFGSITLCECQFLGQCCQLVGTSDHPQGFRPSLSGLITWGQSEGTCLRPMPACLGRGWEGIQKGALGTQ